jgi:L-arabinose isomerase
MISTAETSALQTSVGRKHTRPRVGVFNVGFHRYWPQFPGLREELDGYRVEFEDRLREMDVEIISAGLVDTVDSGRKAGDHFASQNVDIIFCFVTTYVQSAFIVPVAQRGKAHMVLVGLQPTAGMDVTKVTTRMQLAHDNCTSLPEIMYAMRRCGLRADTVFGMLHGDERSAALVREWIYAAKAVHALKNTRIGLLGHPFEGMLDMNVDPTSFTVAFGAHIDMIEMGDLAKRVDNATEEEIAAMTERINNFFTFP